MTTARFVPTAPDGGDEPDAADAWHVARRHGLGTIARDAFSRFRHGDGTSHSRALALLIALAVIPFVLALTGLATELHQEKASSVAAATISRVSPGGGSSDALAKAVEESDSSSHAGQVALVVGLLLSFASMTMAMAQVERGTNRIYGIDGDRPSRAKYTHAAKLAAVLAPPLALGFLLLVAGGAFADAASEAYGWSGGLRTTYDVLRWPVGVVMLVVALTALLDRAPRRDQPGLSWLALGAGTTIVITVAATLALAVYAKASSTLGDTYGPLAGVVVLLVWSQATSVALFAGASVCAQLEALREGRPDPVDD